jgi:CheY-like chemotaxis protein
MSHGILLVGENQDILKLLHSTLDSLKNLELEIYEAPSGEEALLEASRHPIDLLVTAVLLPGITGVELMHKIRSRHPDLKSIFIGDTSDRKVREKVLNSGASAIFDKPVPLADFLDAVERSLDLERTILPPESPGDVLSAARQARLSDLLANFRQDMQARAVLLLNDRGLVLARAGDLYDTSMEVSLLSALSAIQNAGLKVSRYIHQETVSAYYVFGGGDHDLLFVPVDAMYGLLVAGDGLVQEQRVNETVQAVLALRVRVEKSLKSMGVTDELMPTEEAEPPVVKPKSLPALRKKKKSQGEENELPSPELESLLNKGEKQMDGNDLDTYWDQAAEKQRGVPTDSDVISYEEARKMGLAPDKDR